jgi:hypothetical protein
LYQIKLVLVILTPIHDVSLVRLRNHGCRRLVSLVFLQSCLMSGAPFPGPTQPYAPPYGYNNNANQSGVDHKDPYAGGRFKPKKKVNDLIFLILFIFQVHAFPPRRAAQILTMSGPAAWFRRPLRHNPPRMDCKRRIRRRIRKGRRPDRPSSDC